MIPITIELPSNEYIIENALPMKDIEGMNSTNYFEFSVTTTASTNDTDNEGVSIPYEITITESEGNTLTNNQTTMVMVQEFIPNVKFGDHRVLTLGDKILPYSIKKLPSGDDFKFNTHDDRFLVKSELTREQLEYFTPIAKSLNEMGIAMAGLDVVGGKVIEINVTSPCYFIREINQNYGIHFEDKIMACLDVGSDTVKCVVGEMVKRKLNIFVTIPTHFIELI